ncbi:hypothetical protein BC830DRAFT_1103089 [Chytriomyces sp. MP71]|nr:hypothetical protein BC830DRAFT_1103089 [Chytriomyces sp. MP71]
MVSQKSLGPRHIATLLQICVRAAVSAKVFAWLLEALIRMMVRPFVYNFAAIGGYSCALVVSVVVGGFGLVIAVAVESRGRRLLDLSPFTRPA